MADRIKEIPKKILEWWNKFTSKQKTIIIAAAAGVIVAFAILITLLTRPQYVLITTCDSTKETSEIVELLENASPAITYKTSDDGYQISVLKQQVSQARILLGANNIPTDAYDFSNVVSGGLSKTESDKQKMYREYLQSQLETDLKGLSSIRNATVELIIPEDDGTLISQKEDSSAAIWIEPESELTDENINALAQFVRTALGNEEIKNITIIDHNGNLLFSGDQNYSAGGSATSQMGVKQKMENILQGEVKRVLLGTNEFDLIEVSSNLSLDFSVTERVSHEYTPADGQSQGVLSSESLYEAQSEGGVAGVPGAESNGEDGTTYVTSDGSGGSSSVTQQDRKYVPNETMETKTIPAGAIKYDESSLSVAAVRLRAIREEDAKSQGLLDGISWDEYKLANGERTRIEVDESLVDVVAKASGISAENISFVAYEEPMFIDRQGVNINASDIAQIVLIIVILGLLAFVIIRGMRTGKVQEVEEELSVESLLQSTPETELENIELEAKSETRKLIEKFVDENPEAAAALLRNWLNEDWG